MFVAGSQVAQVGLKLACSVAEDGFELPALLPRLLTSGITDMQHCAQFYVVLRAFWATTLRAELHPKLLHRALQWALLPR